MQKFSKQFELPIGEIFTNKKLFQGRSEDFSQATYDKIMREGFDVTQDPIIVWKDKDLERYFVISGHSRLAAAQKLYNNGAENLSVLPVKEFLGDLEDAVKYATLESNRSGTKEGLISDIKAYKSATKSGCNAECLKGYFKTQPYINMLQRLSYLDENGKFIEYLADETLAKQFTRLQQIAEWTGEVRKNYDKLTDKHEKEIFEFIYDGKDSVPNKKEDFLKPIDKAAGSVFFDSKNPLNLKNFVFKSIYQIQAETQVQMLEKEIATIKEMNEVLMTKIRKFDADGKDTTEFERNLISNVKLIGKKEIQMQTLPEYAKEATNASLDLFAQAETTTKIAPREAALLAMDANIEDFENGVKTLNKVIEIDKDAFEPFDKGNYKEFSEKVNAFLRQYWRNETDFDIIKNTQTGFEIGFDNTGIAELSEARRGETKMKALSKIKQIIEDAILFDVKEDKNNNSFFIAIYKFLSFIKYDGLTYEYKSVVKQSSAGKFIYATSIDVRKPLEYPNKKTT